MISLEQIHTLEKKVQAAVTRIRSLSDEKDALTAENVTLKERLESYEERVAELQTLVSAFKADQEEIEAGIVAALGHLDELEDTVSEPPAATPPPPDEPQPEPPAEDAPEDSEPPESDGPSVESVADDEAGLDDEEAEPELDIF